MGSASYAITVYLETSLSTRLATTVSCNDTLPLLKRKLEDEHRLSFGDVKVISLKVNNNGIFYTLSNTISLKQALGAHTECHLCADVEKKTEAKMTKSKRKRQKRWLKKTAAIEAHRRENTISENTTSLPVEEEDQGLKENSLASIQEVHQLLPSTLDVNNDNTDAAGNVERKTDTSVASLEKLGYASQSQNEVIASSVLLAEEVKNSTIEDSEIKGKKETTVDSSTAAYVLETPLESQEDQEISTKSEAGKFSSMHSKADCVLPRPDATVSKKVFKDVPERQNNILRSFFQNRTSFPKKNTIPKVVEKSVANCSGAEILAEMNQGVGVSNSKKTNCVVPMLDKTSSKEVTKSVTISISSDESCKIHTILEAEADKKQSIDDGSGTEILDDGSGTEILDDGSGTVIEQTIAVSNSEKEKSDKKDQNKMDKKCHLDVTLNEVASGKASGEERAEVSNSCKTRKTSAKSVAPGKNGDLDAISTSSSYSSSDSESSDLSMRKPMKRVPFDEFMQNSSFYKKAKVIAQAAVEREDALRQQVGEAKLPDYYIF